MRESTMGEEDSIAILHLVGFPHHFSSSFLCSLTNFNLPLRLVLWVCKHAAHTSCFDRLKWACVPLPWSDLYWRISNSALSVSLVWTLSISIWCFKTALRWNVDLIHIIILLRCAHLTFPSQPYVSLRSYPHVQVQKNLRTHSHLPNGYVAPAFVRIQLYI